MTDGVIVLLLVFAANVNSEGWFYLCAPITLEVLQSSGQDRGTPWGKTVGGHVFLPLGSIEHSQGKTILEDTSNSQ